MKRIVGAVLLALVALLQPLRAQKAFVYTDPVDVAQLKSECLLNPNGYTYTDPSPGGATRTLTEWFTLQDDGAVVTILNQTRAGILIPRTDVRLAEVREAIDLQDLDSTVTGAKQAWVQAFLAAPETVQLLKFNAARTNLVVTQVLTNLRNSMTDTFGSETRLRAIGRRTGSRAEQLWACKVSTDVGCENVTVNINHVQQARRLP